MTLVSLSRRRALSDEQYRILLAPIAKSRVVVKDRQSNVVAYDVRARLNVIFGPAGWSAETLQMVQIFEQAWEVGEAKKPGWRCAYRAQVQLTIHATGAVYTEWAMGDGTMPEQKRGDCHDFAIKTAESQAFKRCAMNLGDQFGLSLYNRGSLAPTVRYTLVGPADTRPVAHAQADPEQQVRDEIDPDQPQEPADDPRESTAVDVDMDAVRAAVLTWPDNWPKGGPAVHFATLQAKATRQGVHMRKIGNRDGEEMPVKEVIAEELEHARAFVAQEAKR